MTHSLTHSLTELITRLFVESSFSSHSFTVLHAQRARESSLRFKIDNVIVIELSKSGRASKSH